ncbi:MAG: FAD-dependent oxidoreductase [Armatimonadetes bacterium]|nr:FAD-dependent oxidoreductase [Armatimonadota bacterium]
MMREVAFPVQGYLPEVTEATVREAAREVPVIADVEVCVLGGGTTGVCAAVAAARSGASVLLVEHYGFLGGMATSSMVLIWHSFYGMDHQTKVIGGLPDEIVARLRAMDGIYNAKEDDTSHWVIDADKTRFVLDDFVLAEGVKLLLHSKVVGAIRDGRRIVAALVESKSGRGAIRARTFIEATGDGDLIRFAGGQTEVGDREGGCQAPSLCFRIRNVDQSQTGLDQVQARLYALTMDYNGGKYPPLLWGARWPGTDDFMLAGTRVLDVNSADALSLTRAEVEGRYQLRWFLREARKLPGWEQAELVAMGVQIGLRESHRILAEHQLTREEVLAGVRFPDAIGQGTYPVDIHNPRGPGIVFEQLDGLRREIKGDRTMIQDRWDGAAPDAPTLGTLCYQIPYGSLIPLDFDNVLVGGRCCGATHGAAGAIRVMVNCMQTGQAAGLAAAMTKDDVREVEVGELQGRLREWGMPLPETR